MEIYRKVVTIVLLYHIYCDWTQGEIKFYVNCGCWQGSCLMEVGLFERDNRKFKILPANKAIIATAGTFLWVWKKLYFFGFNSFILGLIFNSALLKWNPSFLLDQLSKRVFNSRRMLFKGLCGSNESSEWGFQA